jgi:hypothetical protein
MHWINANQTPKERREKYERVKKSGLNYHQARVMRDWSNGHIERQLKFLKDNKQNG